MKRRISIKKVIYQKKILVTEHLREFNLCTDIKMPASALYLYISSTACARSMHDVRGLTLPRELHGQHERP